MHNIGTKKLFLILFIAFFLLKNGMQEFLWQQIFSSAIVEKSNKEPELVESLTLYEEPVTEKMRVGGEDFYMKKVGKYQGWARAMHTETYNFDFYIGFRPLSAKYDKFFNDIAQADIALSTGETAKEGNWQKFKVYHKNRCAITEPADFHVLPKYNPREISNNHIIPANKNIRRVFDIIQRGKIVYIEGYLVDIWGKIDGINEMKNETARNIGQFWTDFKYGG